MALFGFNKQKVLASAEKYVQQGKLQNAISEYEKILKNDAKDLTVTNTVGDLYSRLGDIDKATECFKTVGDAYAAQGFTVKAIAMYKKTCKLRPSLESLLRLAELYTQQGLFNDARAQYLQVAEEFLKAGELDNAVRIFQKILEMDPENSAMRVRLAEVYVRLGKKTEAWQIFSAAAESMRSKGSLSGAEEVLQRMLTLDPGNTYALLMQGKNMIESGDAAGAVATLQKIPDIDSKPDGLRDLLKAYLMSGQLSEAGTVANKLLSVHNDLAAIASFADALMQAGQFETALQVFDQHADRMLAENSDKVLESLHTIIGHVRDNPDSLQKLLDLFQKAGETTHVSEVIELLAHASVQAGDLPRARDLYQRLAQVEPQNPLHMQNYQQVVSQLGGATSTTKLITPEEAVVLIDDLEATAPSVHQHYSDEVALSVRSALTDAELFISYNMPAKALGPLMSALPMAPNDLRINQRLAALYTRSGQFAEAAICCRTLQTVYSDADLPEEATRYGELAERYELRSTAPVEEEEALSDPGETALQEDSVADHTADTEFPADDDSVEISVVDEDEAPAAEEVNAETASPWPAAESSTDAEITIVDESATTEPAEVSVEADASSEWDEALTVEADAPAEEIAVEPVAEEATTESVRSPKEAETIEEIRFYLEHSMPEQAMAALAKLQALSTDEPMLAQLRDEVEAAVQAASERETLAAEPEIEEIAAEDIPAIEINGEAPAAIEAAAPVEEVAAVEIETPVQAEAPAEPETPEQEIPVVAEAVAEPEPVVAPPVVRPVARKPVAAEPAPAAIEHAAPVAQPAARQPVSAPEPEPHVGVLKDVVSDIESSLPEQFLPDAAKPVAPVPVTSVPAAATHAEPAVAEAKPAPVLNELVTEIEASLGDDFLKGAPVVEAQPPIAPASAAAPAAIAQERPSPMAAGAAASAGSHIMPAASASAAVAPVAAIPAVPSGNAHPQPAAPAEIPAVVKEAGIDLAEMFGELKQDLESDTASADEDPETHYSLGIAFREMGLLDEAIGELQKACLSFDKGHPFPQIMQTYTWLAQCFLDKNVPEAAVRWYEKALKVPNLDGETRVSLHYELASAYETAGDKSAALRHFMDVYGSNIDYRDVSERIQALKS